jgi:hypothetical protein
MPFLDAEHDREALKPHDQTGIKQIKADRLFESPLFFEIEQILEHIFAPRLIIAKQYRLEAGNARFSLISG